MKALLWVGVVLLALGIVSLFVPIPHNESEGLTAGNMHVGIQVQHNERVSPIISGVLILGGIGIVVAGYRDSMRKPA